jgi:hypothetical protein
MSNEFLRPPAGPSIYDWLVTKVRPLLAQGAHVLLLGGPGLGKTSVAEQLRSSDVHWISGQDLRNDIRAAEERGERDYSLAVQALEAALAQEGPIFIDDLELIFAAETYVVIDEIVRRQKSPLLITTTYPPNLNVLADKSVFGNREWPRKLVDSWSRLFQLPDLHKVDPWVKGWKPQIASILRAMIGDGAESAPAVSAWWTIVLHLTGGHPVMLNEALSGISRVYEIEESRDGLNVDPGQWKQRYAQMEEYLLRNGVRRLRRALNWLEQNYPAAKQTLEHFAIGKIGESEIPILVRSILIDSGLTHRGHAAGMVVSGAVLRQYLAEGQVEGKIATDPSIELVPRPAEETTGDIVVRVADSSISVPIRDTLWKIIDELNKAKPHPLSIEELELKAVMKSGALRSALQRLRDDLKELGVEGVIENVPGEGYRMGEFPILLPVSAQGSTPPRRARRKVGEKK